MVYNRKPPVDCIRVCVSKEHLLYFHPQLLFSGIPPSLASVVHTTAKHNALLRVFSVGHTVRTLITTVGN